jgi:hypothetical protein
MKLRNLVYIVVLAALLVLLVTGKLSYILLIFGIPGIAINLMILIVASILVYKLVEKILMVLLIPLILIFLLVLYALLVVQAPIHGKVLNALNNQPLEGIVVERAANIGVIALHAGAVSPKWKEKTTSSSTGEFSFPSSIHFTIPFVEYFNSSYCFVQICDQENCSNMNLANTYHNNNYYKIPQVTKWRYNFVPIENDIYLMPRVGAADCDKMINDWLIEECKKLNP